MTEEERGAVGIADDLPYRIVEEMGLGLTFRSCACGQLPCARLRPLRDALETVGRNAATAMRDACVETIRGLCPQAIGAGAFKDAAIRALESLTLDQVEQEKQ